MSEKQYTAAEEWVEVIAKRVKACPIPMMARADWQGTNHYEVQDPVAGVGGEYWWLDVFDAPADSTTEAGQRLGAVLDAACSYRRDCETLLEVIRRLKGESDGRQEP